MWLDDDNDDEKNDTKDEPMGGPGAGDYTPPVHIPGESEAVPNSEQ